MSDIQRNGAGNSSTSLLQNRCFPKLRHSQLSILQYPNANMNVVALEQGTVEDKNSSAYNKHLSLQAHSMAAEKQEAQFPFLNGTSNHKLSHTADSNLQSYSCATSDLIKGVHKILVKILVTLGFSRHSSSPRKPHRTHNTWKTQQKRKKKEVKTPITKVYCDYANMFYFISTTKQHTGGEEH